MTIKPDPREIIWYDLNNILKMPSDNIEHYWSALIGQFKAIDDNQPQMICKKCNSQQLDFFGYNNKIYCENGWGYKVVVIKGKPTKRNLHKKEDGHEIIVETTRQSINRILNRIYEITEEVGGFKYNLYTLESALFMAPYDFYFETKKKEVSKRQVMKLLYEIEKIIRDRLIVLRQTIRFSSQLRTAPIRM